MLQAIENNNVDSAPGSENSNSMATFDPDQGGTPGNTPSVRAKPIPIVL